MEENKENAEPAVVSLGDSGLEHVSEKRTLPKSFTTNLRMAKSLRYSAATTGSIDLHRNDSYSQSVLDELQLSIEQKSNEIDHLETEIMTLKTQRANHEFEIFKVEDKQNQLQKDHDTLMSQIAELEQHEQASLRELNNKYELERKRHIQDHEESLHKLKEHITQEIEEAFDQSLGKLQDDIFALKKKKESLEQQIAQQDLEFNRKLINLKEDHNKRLLNLNQSLDDSLLMLESSIEQVDTDKRIKTEELASLQSSRESNELKINQDRKSELQNLQMEFKLKQDELKSLHDGIAVLQWEIYTTDQSLLQMKKEIDSFQDKSADIYTLMEQKEEVRRKLHNRLQELKGNIRVFCRVRPTCGESKPVANFEYPELLLNDDSPNMLVVVHKPQESNPNHAGSVQFLFDKIFPLELSNSDVFKEISQLVQSSLDGYNVCVFAYGQTGSGKTFTMAHDTDGMIPMSLKKLFQDTKNLESHGWKYEIEGQFLEIYNEAIFDLLSPTKPVSRSPTKTNSKKHEIKHDDVNGTTKVTNMTSVSINGTEHAMKLLSLSNSNRSTAYTKSNAHSSRSHSIFMLQIRGFNTKTHETRNGTLNLVDLAGSERLSSSQAQAERLKETQAINKSLSSLGDVICALKSNSRTKTAPYIPYRNSKLTYLLKNSLGGDCKTLMFVNISPFANNINETLNSLRFATKVNTTSQIRGKGL